MAESMSPPTNAPGQLLLDPPAKTRTKARLQGVDVTRGIALISMLAANTFPVLNNNGTPTIAVMTATGRAATLFVMVAGISLAFITGGRHPVQGRDRRGARVAIAVRALLITVIGLILGFFAGDLTVILAYYGAYFLLAVPLLFLRPRTLVCIAGALIVVSPLLLLASYKLGLNAPFDNLTLSSPFTDPGGFILQVFVTGDYPAVVYLIYICAGIAIGRLDLSSIKVAVRLLVGGLVLAVTAWEVSGIILYHLGGLQHLQAAGAADPGTPPAQITNQIAWDPNDVASWWWLAGRAHHSGTPFDAIHTLGVAMAVLGAVLLITKLRIARRLLWPVGVAGAMTLTIYSAHALILNSGLLSSNNYLAFVEQVAGALAFAVIWYRLMGQGPLERVVATVAGRARRAVMARSAQTRPEDAASLASSIPATAPLTLVQAHAPEPDPRVAGAGRVGEDP